MPIRALKLSNFRNLSSLNLELSDSVNFIIGNNGTGKTSILEAIYLLSSGRSFRTSNLSKLIKFNCDYLSINAVLAQGVSQDLTTLVDYQRTSKSDRRLLLNNCPAKSAAQIAALLPVCNIDGEAFHALSSAPMYRRQLYDWGLFHVKHEFLNLWRRYEELLRQRNALLRQQIQNNPININRLRVDEVWNKLFIDAAIDLIQIRQTYFSLLESEFIYYIEQLLPKFSYQIRLGLNHGLGADLKKNKILDLAYLSHYLHTFLTDKLHHDLSRGYTSIGPHRMDVVFKYNDQVAKDFVSRGQQKLIIVAFYLAQLKVIREQTGKKCTVLIDDLAAELDGESWCLLYQQLLDTDHQLIFSTLNQPGIPTSKHAKFQANPLRTIKMFHVEQMEQIEQIEQNHDRY